MATEIDKGLQMRRSHQDLWRMGWLSLCVCSVFFVGFDQATQAQSPTNASAGQSSPSVGSRPSISGNVSYEGFSRAIQDVQVSTEEIGQLIDVPVELGQAIKKGQILAQLDDRLERAAVVVSSVQASMEGEIAAAKATYTMQAQRLAQLKQLQRDQMAGADEVRRAELELAVADARWLIAREQRELREAELERLSLQIERRKLRAPFDAIVAEKHLDTGAAVTPGTSMVVRLIRTDLLVGVFNVPAEKSFAMHTGMATQVFFRAARQTVDGVIESLSPVINGESGTVEVRVRIDNPDGSLRPGDRCSMRIAPIPSLTRNSNASNFK